MNVLIIDDTPSVLLCLQFALRNTGHAVSLFLNPTTALANLAPDTDLVIANINMPCVNGFQVADEIVARLGSALPRTLLISGDPDYRSAADALPPSTVIGLMAKPFRVAAFLQVVGFLQETRSCCPGQLLPGMGLPPQACGAMCSQGTADSCLCLTNRYGVCRRYNSGCGLRLREHIQALQK